jgi:GT2 family glycosyltransferase
MSSHLTSLAPPSQESAPRRVTAAALEPVQLLDQVPGAPGTWRSLGDDPQFVARCRLPAGWVRIRLKMTSSARGKLEIYADAGAGFTAETCIERAEVWSDVANDFFVHLPAPVRAIRFDPLDTAGEFRVLDFRIDPVPPLAASCRAAWGKLRLIVQHRGLLLPALRRGLRLLARGELATFAHKLFRGLRPSTIVGPDFTNLNEDYQEWRRRRRLTDADRARMATQIAALASPPRISVLMPIYNPPEKYLSAAIESVLRQTYPHWELCIADDASTATYVRPLLEDYTRREPRIRLVRCLQNGGIAAASNAALEQASGDFVALLDHDDELAEHALFRVAEALAAEPDIDLIYSDEDKLELDGRHVEPYFKPDWSPELFLACMYTCHLGVYRTALVRELGGFRPAFDAAQDYDLALRLIERTQRIHHIPDVLYHWRKLPTSAATQVSAKPQAPAAAQRALREHLQRTGQAGTVEAGVLLGLHRVRLALQGTPRVSIIIPSACRPLTSRSLGFQPDRRAESRKRSVMPEPTYHILHCVDSIRRRSTYGHYEVLLVHHPEAMSSDLSAALDDLGVARLARAGAFNWSAAMNLGAATAGGDYLLFLNDDTEVISPDWLESLLEFSQKPEIGAVGPKLLFADGGIQHAGVVVADLTPRHAFYRCSGDYGGYFSSNIVHRNVSAVTGACLMTRADVFHQLGGFCEELPLNYSDVDYCLRVLTSGRRVIYTPHAQLYHFEGATKPGTFESELIRFRERWRGQWDRDPCYNPNLSARFPDYRIELG